MNRWCSCATALLVFAVSTFAFAADLVLIDAGKPAAVIVVPDPVDPAADAAVARAAAVFADHLFQMSGARLEIRQESELGQTTIREGTIVAEPGKLPAGINAFIFIGDAQLARQAGFTAEGLGAGGILVETRGNALALLGPITAIDPQANLYAVVSCLEDLGCRYLWPGEMGKVIPRRSTVAIAPVERRFTPSISQRRIRWMKGMTERPASGLKRLGLEVFQHETAHDKAMATVSPIAWTEWHGLGGHLGISGGHAGSGLKGGWNEHGQQHPEWFALQADGTRDQSKAGDRWQLCISNPALIEFVANDIIRQVNEAPETRCVSLSPNDGGYSSFCLCDECKKLDPPDAPRIKLTIFKKVGEPARDEVEAPSLTDRHVWYWNQVAQRVTAVHPNLLFLGEAYSAFTTPPVREKLHPNLVIRYVPATMDGWDAWRQAGARRIYWRPNIILEGRRDGMLHVLARQLADTMKYAADNGVLATDFDSIIHNWAVQGLNYYAAARLNWDPNLPADAIIADYAKAGFGAAHVSIEQYFQRIEQITLDDKRVFTVDNLAELRGLLSAADQAAAGDEAVLARIAFLRLGLNYTDLHTTLDRMSADAAGKSGADLAAAQAAAKPLLDLHFMVLRDIVKNHNLAINAAYLMWASGEFHTWTAIGGRGYRPSDAVLAHSENRSQTGKEKSVSEMRIALGLDQTVADQAVKAPRTSNAEPKVDLTTAGDADEQGRPVEALK